MPDVARLVLDANIMVSALIGRSFTLFEQLVARGIELYATDAQLAETHKTLSGRPFATPKWVDNQIARLLTAIMVMPLDHYLAYEAKARSRLHERGQPDWPVLAASIEIAGAVWSHDKDFFGSGAPVWSTFMLNRQLEIAEL
jgi:predicted nucleic acid-binding protein